MWWLECGLIYFNIGVSSYIVVFFIDLENCFVSDQVTFKKKMIVLYIRKIMNYKFRKRLFIYLVRYLSPNYFSVSSDRTFYLGCFRESRTVSSCELLICIFLVMFIWLKSIQEATVWRGFLYFPIPEYKICYIVSLFSICKAEEGW